ncbi:solute carrier family 35 member F4 isoform X3 [Stegostoma tigrinum]|uniref:solute carrier family 35 member F4 isoform X3 n=2 Tax=Stegostoma tigrinum TaxID=3053191 RepID=UPI00202B2567|nr:solute carrier family 35 member F4 isoform X3 [Stegostoma tigrinum]
MSKLLPTACQPSRTGSYGSRDIMAITRDIRVIKEKKLQRIGLKILMQIITLRHAVNRAPLHSSRSSGGFWSFFLYHPPGECSRIFGEEGLTLRLFLKRTAPFSILWTLTNYLYLLALKKLTATDVSALFCCNKAFVFLLSWIVLKDKFMGVRIVAAIMAITGIVMMAYADGFHGDSIIGVALVVGSASTSALYKVLFKMFLGSANFGEAAYFISTLGFFNLIFISSAPVILYFTKVEYWSSFSALPWGYLCGVAGLWLAFNILVNVGVVLTYPILISIGTVLSVPGNAAVDLMKHEVIFSMVRLTATTIICIGFLLMLLPEEWDEITLRFINRLKEKKNEDQADDTTESSIHTRSRSRANGTVSIPLA